MIKTLPPIFSIPEGQKFVKENYGKTVTGKNLFSDIGQNFHLTDESGKEYILKIANPAERKEMLDAQNQTIKYVAGNYKDINFQSIIRTLSGEEISTIIDKNGNKFLARLLTYLPGIFLADIHPHTPEMLKELGSKLGLMDKLLSDFYHPAANRYWHWDLKNATDLKRYTKHISHGKNRRIAEYFLLQFETEVLPVLPTLRKSIIHNDANDHNILVSNINKDEYKISGFIDFGDMVYSNTIGDLAIACAYVMLEKNDPLESILPIVSGYHLSFQLTEPEIDVLFYLITARLFSSVIIAAYQQSVQENNDYLSISEKPAWTVLHKLIEINPIKAVRKFRNACNFPALKNPSKHCDEILKIRKKHLGRSLSVSFKEPINIVRGAMQYLFDDSGNTYLDCVNNVSHVGHCHPRIVRAAQQQMAALNTNTRYLHENLALYAQRLTALFPEPLNVCFFVNSGSEANELAIRLARTYTQNEDFIVIDNAYHGNTSSVVEISPYKYEGHGGKGEKPYIHKVIMPDTYRGPIKETENETGKKYAGYVEKVIQNNKQKIAGFFCEPLIGCGGQIVLPDNYLSEAFRYIRNAGGVCIADEVQIGFGRVGSHFWGFETQNVIPDIVTLGKPIGNGHPLGAVVTTKEIADAFDNGMEYFNTFGGNPVSCAVGLAVLDVIKEEKLQENALNVGSYFKKELELLKNKYELIGDVRGLGLFLGAELVSNRETLTPAAKQATYIIERLKEMGIQLSIDGPLHNVLKIKPSMVFSYQNVELVIKSLDQILGESELYKQEY